MDIRLVEILTNFFSESQVKEILINCYEKMNKPMNVGKQDPWKVENVVTKYRTENIDGITFSVFKSAFQKFLRRNECKKGLGTLRLMSNFNDGTDDGNKLISNIINRQIVIMSEEISINNPNLPVLMKSLYERFLSTRNYNLIYVMYKELCRSGKCRLLSDLKATFNLRPYYLNDSEQLKEIHKKIISGEEYPLSDLYELSFTEQETLKLIKQSLEERSYDAFVYVSYYMLKDYIAGRGGPNLWKIVVNCASGEAEQTVNALKFFYTKMTHKEKPLYLYQAMLTIIHQDSLDFEPIQFEKVSLTDDFEYPLTNGKFPEYVYDIHTGNKKKGVLDFALEGAYIEDEDKTYKNDKWRKNYVRFKKLLEGKEEEEDKEELGETVTEIVKKTTPSDLPELNVDFLFDCIRGQKLTSSSKPFVFIPTDTEKYGKMVGFVYKGPYDKGNRRNFIMSWRTDILKAIGTKWVLLPRKIKQAKNDWFEYEYIGDPDNVYFKEEHDNVSNTDVKILDREKSGVKQFSKLSDKIVYDILFGSKKMILSLVDLVILGTGDMGFWNMLLSYNNVPWVVDIEDSRPNEKNDLPIEESIFTRTSKANIQMFKKGITEAKSEIISHLRDRRQIDWSEWDTYWDYLKRKPVDTIDELLSKLE
jgi:hypothetical protein